jgi:LuxR family transcriptional regulator of csgAB operon
VRGFLYEEDPLDWLKEGILAVLDGEIWLSRKMFLQCLLEGRTTDYPYKERISSLTAREAEVLALVATWASNQEIAERLCISSHTVKTHLYNIFKKIDVSDRRQAALWALKNLERITTRR